MIFTTAQHAASISHRPNSGFSVGRTMFGQEGTALTTAPSFDEALTLAGVNFSVEKVPAYSRISVPRFGGGEDVEYVPAKDAFIVRRTDTFEALGHVGARYQVAQNRDALRAIEPLYDDGLVKPEAGGVFDGGSTSWMMFRFDADEINRRSNGATEGLLSTVEPFGIVLLRHDGRGKNLIQQLPMRIACLNVLPSMRGSDGAEIRHTGEANRKTIEEAEAIFGTLAASFADMAELYRAMKTTIMSAETFDQLLDVAFPISAVRPGESARAATERVNQAERRTIATDLRWNGSGHSGTGDTWEAVNGIIEALDHGDENKRGRNLKSNIVGSRNRIKTRLFKFATAIVSPSLN